MPQYELMIQQILRALLIGFLAKCPAGQGLNAY
jgi:hypothetical protein